MNTAQQRTSNVQLTMATSGYFCMMYLIFVKEWSKFLAHTSMKLSGSVPPLLLPALLFCMLLTTNQLEGRGALGYRQTDPLHANRSLHAQ